jgi:uncharacterized protein (TIGR02246 family)
MSSVATDRTAVAHANRAFYDAFESRDATLMAKVWDDGDDVTCIHPGWEILAGSTLVQKSFELIFANIRSIRFTLEEVTLRIAGDTAFVHCVEDILIDSGNGMVLNRAVATNAFVRRKGKWRMILHHASAFERRMTDSPPSAN